MLDLENIINDSENYIAEDMDEIKIDEVPYNEYSEYTFTWEKTYVKSPERSSNGSMGNLNELYATFNTPHLTVKYDIMPIDAYRSVMKQLLSKNEFNVTCYDPIYNETITKKMYFATPSAPVYYCKTENNVIKLLGVRDYTIELIGTNND